MALHDYDLQLGGGDRVALGAATHHPVGDGGATIGRRRTWRGKLALDIVLSAILIVLTAPLLVVIAVAVKMSSMGPALFRQPRVGRNGKEFFILKFRTMHRDAEQRLRADPSLNDVFVRGGHKIPCRIDPRVTPLGRALRQTSLDELPQLFNVLCGQMSLVGPRPVERSQLPDYGEHEAVYLLVRPGLTGLWQVSGRSTVVFPQRAELDAEYLRCCGPWLDAKILLRTPLAIVSGRGAD